jgi:hypothetical protein
MRPLYFPQRLQPGDFSADSGTIEVAPDARFVVTSLSWAAGEEIGKFGLEGEDRSAF